MIEESEKQQEGLQKSTLVDPMKFYDKSQIKEAMIFYERTQPGEPGFETPHEQRKPIRTRKQFLDEMRLKYGVSDESSEEEKPTRGMRREDVPHLDIAKVEAFLGIRTCQPERTAQEPNGYLTNTATGQDAAGVSETVAPEMQSLPGHREAEPAEQFCGTQKYQPEQAVQGLNGCLTNMAAGQDAAGVSETVAPEMQSLPGHGEAEPAEQFCGTQKYQPEQAAQVLNSYLTNTAAAQEIAVVPKNTVPTIPLSPVHREGIVPLDLVKKMKSVYPMCVVGKDLFVYGEGYYYLMKQLEMESLIWTICEKEVEECGSKNILTGAYQLMLVDPSLKVTGLTQPDNLINFRNGMYRLDDGAFLPHSPAVFTTFTLQCDYYGVGACPVFDKFLYDVTGGDQDLIDRIWEIIGCCLSQEDIKKIFVFQGVHDSGKSVLCNTIDALFPDHAKTAFSVHSLGSRFTEKECMSKALCVSADLAGDPLSSTAVGSLKRLSGRDVICSDVKYGDPVKFRFRGRILLVTNHLLLLKKEDPAFQERIVAVPFRYTIPAEQRDYGLEKKIMGELSAIAGKAIMAYHRLRGNGFRFSGDYPLNSPELFGESVPVADPASLIYLYLQQYFEPGTEDDLVVVDQACEAFNSGYYMEMSPIQFSTIFCRQAAQMYGAEKVRSRAGGYKNARSCLKGIRYRQV